MNKNVRIAKELIRIAKSLVGLDITINNDLNDTGDYSYGDQKSIHDKYEQDILDEAEAQGKKYILHHKQGNLWRIQACKNFGDVKKGDFGGLIELEMNLSQEGDCWIYETVKVYDHAEVFGDAKVYDHAEVFGKAQVFGDAKVYGHAQVFGCAQVSGEAQVYGSAQVDKYAQIYGSAQVCGNAQVGGEAQVYGNASVFGDASVCGSSQIYDDANVCGSSYISCGAKVHGSAWVDNKDVHGSEITE